MQHRHAFACDRPMSGFLLNGKNRVRAAQMSRGAQIKKGNLMRFPFPIFFLPVGLADLLTRRYERQMHPSTGKMPECRILPTSSAQRQCELFKMQSRVVFGVTRWQKKTAPRGCGQSDREEVRSQQKDYQLRTD